MFILALCIERCIENANKARQEQLQNGGYNDRSRSDRYNRDDRRRDDRRGFDKRRDGGNRR